MLFRLRCDGDPLHYHPRGGTGLLQDSIHETAGKRIALMTVDRDSSFLPNVPEPTVAAGLPFEKPAILMQQFQQLPDFGDWHSSAESSIPRFRSAAGLPVPRARSAQALSRPRGSARKGKGKNPAPGQAAGPVSRTPFTGLTAFPSGRRFTGHNGQNPRSGNLTTRKHAAKTGGLAAHPHKADAQQNQP